ncbi:MAG: hypothetical protein ACK53A_01565 [Gemmatimonadota bacterium]|jgi:hypothetical protein|nr:hypothetical protein [Gemmatimonadota bacterium]
MTESPRDPAPSVPWWLQPRLAVPALLAALALVAVLVPQALDTRSGDPRLKIDNRGPLGAGLVADLAVRLGWTTVGRTTRAVSAGDSLVHVVLAPPVPLRKIEAQALLAAVEGGAAALVIPADGDDALLALLRLSVGPSGEHRAPAKACPAKSRLLPRLWRDQDAASLWSLAPVGPFPDPAKVFLTLAPSGSGDSTRRGRTWGMIGIPHGAGRLVIAADPDAVRTDALRVCDYGLDVPLVRALEWLREGGRVPRTTLVFDEFHQGEGAQPGATDTIVAFLAGTGPGRALLVLGAAALLFVASRAPRLVPPRSAERVERRSPMEQVDALARAYEAVGATRTVAQRLVAGVRRRLEGPAGRRRGESDAGFLARVRDRHPELAPDVDVLIHALDAPIPASALPAVGDAASRLDTSLTR